MPDACDKISSVVIGKDVAGFDPACARVVVQVPLHVGVFASVRLEARDCWRDIAGALEECDACEIECGRQHVSLASCQSAAKIRFKEAFLGNGPGHPFTRIAVWFSFFLRSGTG